MVRALGATRLGSLELGVSIPAAPTGRVHLSFAGRNRPRPAINDPRLVFDQIFPGDGNTAACPDAGGPAAQRPRRREGQPRPDADRGRAAPIARPSSSIWNPFASWS